MKNEEKRKHFRTDSLRLLNYLCHDLNKDITTQGMGRTRNVSESGIQLETRYLIESRNFISLTIGFADDVVDVRGRVVYSQKNAAGMYESGIEFFDVDEKSRVVLRQYTAAFNAGIDD